MNKLEAPPTQLTSAHTQSSSSKSPVPSPDPDVDEGSSKRQATRYDGNFNDYLVLSEMEAPGSYIQINKTKIPGVSISRK